MMTCPICKKAVALGDPDFPFCSERCRIIDLGNWATEKYVIPGAPTSNPPEQTKKNDGRRSTPDRTRMKNKFYRRSSAFIGGHLRLCFMTTKLASPLATWFGCGYSPVAPGTAGSARRPRHWQSCFTSTPASPGGTSCSSPRSSSSPPSGPPPSPPKSRSSKTRRSSSWTKSSASGSRSPARARLNWKSYLAAFALFRLFDIWKPPPVRQLEALPGGLGINLDDVMAGVYAALVLFASRMFQSLLNMPLRKPADPKPLISQVTPPAAIAGRRVADSGQGLRAGRTAPG